MFGPTSNKYHFQSISAWLVSQYVESPVCHDKVDMGRRLHTYRMHSTYNLDRRMMYVEHSMCYTSKVDMSEGSIQEVNTS